MKKICSAFLAVILLFGLCAVPGFAEEPHRCFLICSEPEPGFLEAKMYIDAADRGIAAAVGELQFDSSLMEVISYQTGFEDHGWTAVHGPQSADRCNALSCVAFSADASTKVEPLVGRQAVLRVVFRTREGMAGSTARLNYMITSACDYNLLNVGINPVACEVVLTEPKSFMTLEKVESEGCSDIVVRMGASSTVGIASIRAELQFDKTQLEVTSVKNLKESWLSFTGPQSTDSANELGCVPCFADASTGEASQCPTEAGLLEVTFRALDGAPENATVTAVCSSASDYDSRKMIFETVSLEVPTVSSHEWLDADCTTPKTCKICGKTEGKALGHSYRNGVCTVCGEKEPEEPYEGDNRFEVVRISTENEELITVRFGLFADETGVTAVQGALFFNPEEVEVVSYSNRGINWDSVTPPQSVEAANAMAKLPFFASAASAPEPLRGQQKILEVTFRLREGFSGDTVHFSAECESAADFNLNRVTIPSGDFEVDAAPMHNWIPASCETAKTCVSCGRVEGEPLGHDFHEGVCNRCGKRRFMYGDANGDGEISSADGTLFTRYGALWSVEIDLEALDLNNDGEINSADITILTRYLAKWDVSQYPNPVGTYNIK